MANEFLGGFSPDDQRTGEPTQLNPDIYNGVNQIVDEVNGIRNDFNRHLRKQVSNLERRLADLPEPSTPIPTTKTPTYNPQANAFWDNFAINAKCWNVYFYNCGGGAAQKYWTCINQIVGTPGTSTSLSGGGTGPLIIHIEGIGREELEQRLAECGTDCQWRIEEVPCDETPPPIDEIPDDIPDDVICPKCECPISECPCPPSVVNCPPPVVNCPDPPDINITVPPAQVTVVENIGEKVDVSCPAPIVNNNITNEIEQHTNQITCPPSEIEIKNEIKNTGNNHLEWFTDEKSDEQMQLYLNQMGFNFEPFLGGTFYQGLKQIEKHVLEDFRTNVPFMSSGGR